MTDRGAAPTASLDQPSLDQPSLDQPNLDQLSVSQLSVNTAGSGRPVALLHGFTQNAGAWGPFADLLSENRELNAVDLPGHGGSSQVRADLWRTAELVGAACGPSDYIGYSLGGRVLLHMALSRPELVRSAVFIGATAGIEDARERADRVAADELLALRLEAVAHDERGFESFITDWLAGPLFTGLSTEASCLPARLQNSPTDLASSLRLCGTGTQEPLWARVGELSMPVLVLAGERDNRFKEIGLRLARSIGGNATFVEIAGSNHACQLESPSETARTIEHFFAGTAVHE